VNGYAADELPKALDGVEVVVIPAGVPRKVRVLLIPYIPESLLNVARNSPV
jgi:hypothetical protein